MFKTGIQQRINIHGELLYNQVFSTLHFENGKVFNKIIFNSSYEKKFSKTVSSQVPR